MAKVFIPNNLNHNTIEEVIGKASPIFDKVNSVESDFTLDCSNMKKVSMVGLLLIYKIMNFCYEKNCFLNPSLSYNDKLEEALHKYSFFTLMESIMYPTASLFAGKSEINYDHLNINSQPGKFIIAPQPMLRRSNETQEFLRTHYSNAISKFYPQAEAEMILQCVTEISLNFWKHALSDLNSVLVAEGNRSKIEIACADTGDGIISSLREGVPDYKNLSNVDIIQEAVKKRVTSKPGSNHMGMGLWIIDQMASHSQGMFHIYSEGAYYKNIRGNISFGKCGYWKGTVVYLNLPLETIVTMKKIFYNDVSSIDDISLNLTFEQV